MNLLLVIRKRVFFILLFFIAACGGSGMIPPNQNTVNLAINDLTSFALADLTSLGDLLMQSVDCQAFEQSFTVGQDVTGNCPVKGNTVVHLDTLNCSEGTPKSAVATGTETFNNCQDNDSTPTTINGSIDFEEDVTGDTGSSFITSNNYISEGITFVLDITVNLLADGSGDCSGTVTADGFDCILAANCLTCTL